MPRAAGSHATGNAFAWRAAVPLAAVVLVARREVSAHQRGVWREHVVDGFASHFPWASGSAPPQIAAVLDPSGRRLQFHASAPLPSATVELSTPSPVPLDRSLPASEDTPRQQLRHYNHHASATGEAAEDTNVPIVGNGDVFPLPDVDSADKKKNVNATIIYGTSENPLDRTRVDGTPGNIAFLPALACLGLGFCLWRFFTPIRDYFLAPIALGTSQTAWSGDGDGFPSGGGGAASIVDAAGRGEAGAATRVGGADWQAKADAIFVMCDQDGDGFVSFGELKWLARVTNPENGSNYSMEWFRDLCHALTADPLRGLGKVAFRQMYIFLDGSVEDDYAAVRTAAGDAIVACAPSPAAGLAAENPQDDAGVSNDGAKVAEGCAVRG